MSNHPWGFAGLTALELARRIEQGEALVVLDVREPHERAYASIPLPANVVDLHIPMGQVSARLVEIADAARSTHLVVYCHLGVRSAQVAAWLASQGVDRVANLEGGIEAWSVEVDPSVRRY